MLYNRQRQSLALWLPFGKSVPWMGSSMPLIENFVHTGVRYKDIQFLNSTFAIKSFYITLNLLNINSCFLKFFVISLHRTLDMRIILLRPMVNGSSDGSHQWVVVLEHAQRGRETSRKQTTQTNGNQSICTLAMLNSWQPKRSCFAGFSFGSRRLRHKKLHAGRFHDILLWVAPTLFWAHP